MLIQDASNEILISPASSWEIAIHISIGKWKLHQELRGLHRHRAEQLRLSGAADPARPHGEVGRIAVHHRDPFDRLLVAQALVEGLSVVSNDAAFDAYGVKRLW